MKENGVTSSQSALGLACVAPLPLAPAPILQGGSGSVWRPAPHRVGLGAAGPRPALCPPRVRHPGGVVADPRGPMRAVVLDAAHRCVDLLVRTAVIRDTGAPTWLSREVGPGGVVGVDTGRRSLHDGDAGVVWALTHLGTALNRPDATELAASAGRALLRSRPSDPDAPAGLLLGEAGVDLVRAGRGAGRAGWSEGSDLTDGLAGILLSLARTRRHERHAATIISELRRRSRVEQVGRSWPNPRSTAQVGRPSYGVAHGASGVAWALAEAAAVWPELAPPALDLAAEALAWEASGPGSEPPPEAEPSTGPERGRLPDGRADGRADEMGARGSWCRGAAGAGAVRLRILELADAGLEVPWSVGTTRAEAEVLVQQCARAVSAVSAMSASDQQAASTGGGSAAAGWTLCHGVGGPAGVVALAADVLEVPHLREQALRAAAAFVHAAPVDPGAWPSGMRGADGDVSLLTGVAGTAVLLTDLALPGSVPSVVLLGAGGTRATPE